MLLEHSSWPEVEAYLTTSCSIIMPIGSTEQHGPTGLLGTDFLCAEAVARGIGEHTGALVAPTINFGMAQHHTGFPGTISLRPSTLLLVVVDAITSLTRVGFERFFFVNGHGGNAATVNAAFSELYWQLTERDPDLAGRMRCELHNWWQSPGIKSISNRLYGDAEGQHATPSEVALTQHIDPSTIHHAELSPLERRQPIIGSPADFRRRYPDGRMNSNPSLARPEHGAELLATAVDELGDLFNQFVAAE